LFGGILAGALITILIVFYLRSRRRQTGHDFVEKPSGMTYNSGSAWAEEKKGLLQQLNESQSERAQLRTYLQVSDSQDPRDVVELFDKLNVSIKNSCILAGRTVVKSAKTRASSTTSDASDVMQLQKVLDGAKPLVQSTNGKGRKAEDFLPVAFCYVVNLVLVRNIFSLFHPGVSRDENELLLNTYRDIRRRDPQRLAARWRCLTYAAIDRHQPPSGTWSRGFADDVLDRLSTLVTSLFGNVPGGFPANFREELVSIGAEAYKWDSSVKSTFKALDFRPVLFTSADHFDPASMTLYLSHKPDQSPPRKIVAAVTLALRSAESISSEREITEENVWQSKADVLTEGFF